ncbi:MAG: ATP-dependent DNA helicase RecG [Candidatus Fermentibacteria bacterium]|nr:ATP-dependent DNA helicase RecG [Candidatus Fermentibacteria bacterium]
MRTDDSVSCLRGVGGARKALLKRLSIVTIGDLLMHVPTRFLDRRSITPIAEVHPGSNGVVSGTIARITRRPAGRKGPSLLAVLADETGSITLTFFRSGFPGSNLREGSRIVACGVIESFKGYTIVHPELYFSHEATDAVEAPGMLPIYGLTAGLTQRVMRKLTASALESVKTALVDILPLDVIKAKGFAGRWDVFKAVHMPDSPEESATAIRLLALEELYLYRSVLTAAREKSRREPGIPLTSISLEDFESTLPWPLTSAQKRVCMDVSSDLSSGSPMRRLVQGDVGSGKTAVAAFACVVTALAGKTAAVLAPTEVLARQHYTSFSRFCSRFNLEVHILTGGTTGTERKRIGERLLENPRSILIGTHAILEDWVPVAELALLVIDEQHRFGVSQRAKLLSLRKERPHALVMSATPIPRTLAMAFYGDLDISVIDKLPPGRGTTETRVVSGSEKGTVFKFMMERLLQGERVFLVYPLKEASEQSDLMDAASAYETVRRGPMAKFGAGLLHGSMPSSEKVAVTNQFSAGEIAVLVSTTVIEVGIDVPEATVMVIANAERFGLSQLHQLRGRVGRGGRNAWCFLVPGDEASHTSLEKLRLLASTSDGFVIAEKDLSVRGPGQVLGTAQHGLPQFKVADLTVHGELLTLVSGMVPIGLEDIQVLLKSQLWRYRGMELPGV